MLRKTGTMRIRRAHEYRTRLIFEQAKKLWPKKIRIDDGKCNHFPSLSEAWDKSERLAEELDEIDKLATWAMVCCLDELARKRGISACNEIFLCDVRFVRFDYQMRRNLVEPCWADEEILYNLANTQKRSYYFHKRDRKIFQSSNLILNHIIGKQSFSLFYNSLIVRTDKPLTIVSQN